MYVFICQVWMKWIFQGCRYIYTVLTAVTVIGWGGGAYKYLNIHKYYKCCPLQYITNMNKSSGKRRKRAYVGNEIRKEVLRSTLRMKFVTVIMIKSRIPLTSFQTTSSQSDDRSNNGLTIKSATTMHITFTTYCH
jgi:hypothetical protein